MDSIHSGHRRRLRERFRAQGLSGFAEHEVLELLLTFAIPRQNVNPTAHALLRQFGSLSAVLEADVTELMRVEGIGEQAATLIALIPELMGCYQRSLKGKRPSMTCFQEAAAYCASLFYGVHEECIYLICLDQSGRVIHPALLRRGTVDRVSIYPREVVQLALRHHAHGVLLAHNHPSGIAKPSVADENVTRTIARALALVGVNLIDHLVICGEEVHSITRMMLHVGAQENVEYRTPIPEDTAASSLRAGPSRTVSLMELLTRDKESDPCDPSEGD